MKKRVLITGANGMLGGTLVHLFQANHEVFATGTREKSFEFIKNYLPFDLKNDSYEELISWAKPDIVIHCAALTNGNYCEKNPLEALKVNGLVLKKFTDCIGENGKIIYISTDAVFASETHMATEKDCPKPQSMYGKSKELGEFFLLNSEVDFTIIRTTIVGLNFDPSKAGFVEWIINSGKIKEEIGLFDDVLFSPISIWDLSEQIENIIESFSKYSRKILHIAGRDACTKYQFGISLLKNLNFPVEQVKRSSIKEMKGRAKRSTDQSLDCSFYQILSNTKLPDLEDTVKKITQNYRHYEKHSTWK